MGGWTKGLTVSHAQNDERCVQIGNMVTMPSFSTYKKFKAQNTLLLLAIHVTHWLSPPICHTCCAVDRGRLPVCTHSMYRKIWYCSNATDNLTPHLIHYNPRFITNRALQPANDTMMQISQRDCTFNKPLVQAATSTVHSGRVHKGG